jgi:hypothetical protein
MRELIIENQYWPCILYYSLVLRIDVVHIESKEHFVKRSFRNKMQLPGPNGILDLSIPLEKGKSKKSMDEVAISYAENWSKSHLHTIHTLYKNAPFFEHYIDQIKAIYEVKYDRLIDLQHAIHQFIFKALKHEKELLYTKDYHTDYQEDLFIDARNHLLPSAVNIEGFMHQPYMQIFEEKIGFKSNMSVLDLIMCEGPNAIHYL